RHLSHPRHRRLLPDAHHRGRRRPGPRLRHPRLPVRPRPGAGPHHPRLPPGGAVHRRRGRPPRGPPEAPRPPAALGGVPPLAGGGSMDVVTRARELRGALPFIERLAAAGVVVSIGHTAATPEQIHAAVQAGARVSTHLGNGAHAVLPRHQNYIWEQLAADDLWACIICDGHHLPAAVVRCIVRVKTPAQTILTCDAGSLAGLPPGRYREWDQDFEVRPEGKIVVPASGYLAGSWAFTDRCIGNVIRFAGVS